MPIRRLPPLLVNQIAAGEVVERPASVVKELTENALDAGASRIDIVIEGGGATLVRISDDGRGIPSDELTLAVAPHATSKLHDAADLEGVRTLGFRGEAIASIASVSRLRITSRAINPDTGELAEAAACIEVAGDAVSTPRPAAASPGTVVEVRDLFFNTPARRKFLRTPPTEFGHISDIVQRIALAHPRVAFTLTHDTRSTLDLPAQTATLGWQHRALAILGPELADALLPFDRQDRDFHARGMAGLPETARATAKFQHLMLNGRPIRDRHLLHAVKEAYRGLIPPDRYPMAVVSLTCDPAAVDVNVHPTKSEVRFREPQRAHGLILAAVKQSLLAADLTPHYPHPHHLPHASTPRELVPWVPPEPTDEPSDNAHNTEQFVNYFRQMDPTQKGFVYQEVRKALSEENPDATLNQDDQRFFPSTSPHRATPTAILQVHDSYVVTQDEHGLLIVDQHALHERIMFEELRHRLLGPFEDTPEGSAQKGRAPRKLESQRLLMPVTLPADAPRQDAAQRLAPLFDRLGIEVDLIGPSTLAIHAFPTLLFDRHVDPAELIAELLDKTASGDLDPDAAGSDEAALHEVLDMMSCKAAVKAGDHLGEDELAALLARRGEIERSSNCPHGRPTTIRLTLKDLERQFGRT